MRLYNIIDWVFIGLEVAFLIFMSFINYPIDVFRVYIIIVIAVQSALLVWRHIILRKKKRSNGENDEPTTEPKSDTESGGEL